MTADQIRSLQPALAALLEQFRPFFKREGTFKHWERYLLGLMADLKRKSIEPIALAAGVAVRTLQEFLAFFVWGHERVAAKLQQLVMDQHASPQARSRTQAPLEEPRASARAVPLPPPTAAVPSAPAVR